MRVLDEAEGRASWVLLDGAWLRLLDDDSGQLEALDGGQLDGGQLEALDGGQLEALDGGQLEALDGGQLEALDDGQLEALDDGQLDGGQLEALDGGQLEALDGGQLEALDDGQLEALDDGQLDDAPRPDVLKDRRSASDRDHTFSPMNETCEPAFAPTQILLSDKDPRGLRSPYDPAAIKQGSGPIDPAAIVALWNEHRGEIKARWSLVNLASGRGGYLHFPTFAVLGEALRRRLVHASRRIPTLEAWETVFKTLAKLHPYAVNKNFFWDLNRLCRIPKHENEQESFRAIPPDERPCFAERLPSYESWTHERQAVKPKPKPIVDLTPAWPGMASAATRAKWDEERAAKRAKRRGELSPAEREAKHEAKREAERREAERRARWESERASDERAKLQAARDERERARLEADERERARLEADERERARLEADEREEQARAVGLRFLHTFRSQL